MEDTQFRLNESESSDTSECEAITSFLGEIDFIHGIALATVCIILITMVSVWLLQSFRIPRTAIFFILGLALRGIAELEFHWGKVLKSYLQKMDDDPIFIEYVFTSIFLFSWAFTMDGEIFMKIIKECLVLSITGFVISTTIMFIIALYCFPSYEFPLPAAISYGLAFQAVEFLSSGSSIRCNDDRSKHIITLLQGEALINDAICLLLFENLRIYQVESSTVIPRLFSCVLQCVWGIIIGFGFGKFATAFVIWVHGERISEIIIPFSLAFPIYLFSANVFASAPFSVICAAITISLRKQTFSKEYHKAVESIGSTFSFMANCIISGGTGMLVAQTLISSSVIAAITIHDYFNVISTYILLTVSRLLTVLCANLVLERIGAALTWKEAIAATWIFIRGGVAIFLGMSAKYNSELHDTRYHVILFHICGVVCLGYVVNLLTVSSLLDMIDFAQISPVRRASMKNAIYRLRQVVTKSMNVQRMNRHTAIANWQWVTKHTQIEDPYFNQKIILDRTPYFEARYHRCTECNTKELLPLSEEEQLEMTKDMNQRAIKAVQDIYWEQFYNCLIGEKTVHVLISLARAASREQKYLNVDDVKKCMEVERIYLLTQKYINVYLTSINSFLGKKETGEESKGLDTKRVSEDIEIDTISQVEEKLSLLQKLIYHPAFEYIVHTYIILSLVFRLIGIFILHLEYHIIFEKLEDKKALLKIYIQEYMAQIVVLFLLSVLRFLALGYKRYFRSFLNMLCLFLLIFETICFTLSLLKIFDESHYSLFMSGLTSFTLLLRLVLIIRSLLVFFKRVVEKAIDASLHRSFDIAHCFLTGEEEIRKQIDYMVEYEPVADILRHQMRKNLSSIQREIVLMQQRYPNIVIAAKTKLATHGVLHDATGCLKELKEEGVVEDTEFRKLEEIIRQRLTNVSHVLSSSVFSLNPADILGMIEWIVGEEKVRYFLNLEGTSEEVYRPHTYIHSVGSKPLGVHIIVYGIVKVTGRMTKRATDYLPNSDSTLCFESDVYFEEYLSNCQTLGLIGVLNEEPFVANSICETEVRTFFVPLDRMKEAMELFSTPPSLEYQIWRFLSLKIALPILSSQPHWKDSISEKLKLQLEKALLPDLLKERSFIVHQAVQDIVLIQGRVLSYVAQEEFVGPTYIPRTNEHLRFPGNPSTRVRPVLLLLVTEGFELPSGLDWSGESKEEGQATYCTLHALRDSSFRNSSIQSRNSSMDPQNFKRNNM